MLDRECHPYLLKTLCAILMILPQGKIAHMLKNRVEISKMVGKDSSKAIMKEGREEHQNGINEPISGKLTKKEIGLYLQQYIDSQRKIITKIK